MPAKQIKTEISFKTSPLNHPQHRHTLNPPSTTQHNHARTSKHTRKKTENREKNSLFLPLWLSFHSAWQRENHTAHAHNRTRRRRRRHQEENPLPATATDCDVESFIFHQFRAEKRTQPEAILAKAIAGHRKPRNE